MIISFSYALTSVFVIGRTLTKTGKMQFYGFFENLIKKAMEKEDDSGDLWKINSPNFEILQTFSWSWVLLVIWRLIMACINAANGN